MKNFHKKSRDFLETFAELSRDVSSLLPKCLETSCLVSLVSCPGLPGAESGAEPETEPAAKLVPSEYHEYLVLFSERKLGFYLHVDMFFFGKSLLDY